jgi:integrase
LAGSKLGSKIMLSLPIYLRGNTYYLHTRIAGKQFKRSLDTNNKNVAIILASKILESVHLDKIKKFEVDLSRGILKADGPEDHKMMMEALAMYAKAKARINGPESTTTAPEVATPTPTGLKVLEVLEKFFLLKTHLKEATVLSYKGTIEEFSTFLKKPYINAVQVSDITRYQEFLAKKKNTSRTIDSKISTVKTIFNFAIAQGYYFQKNPAENRKLQSKRERLKGGYAIFKEDEIKQMFTADFLQKAKEDDPDYYWALVLGLVTGARISEITGLQAHQFKFTAHGNFYIDVEDAKSLAGIREIPVHNTVLDLGLSKFLEGKTGQVFKYKLRLGKGSGNAVGKKFKRHLEEVKITRDKLVFHSLRKFANDYFLKNNIEIEPRCQYFGHEIDNVNIQTYSRKFTADELYERTKAVQMKILMLAEILKTKF